MESATAPGLRDRELRFDAGDGEQAVHAAGQVRQHQLSRPLPCLNEHADAGRIDELQAGEVEYESRGVGVLRLAQNAREYRGRVEIEFTRERQHHVTLLLAPLDLKVPAGTGCAGRSGSVYGRIETQPATDNIRSLCRVSKIANINPRNGFPLRANLSWMQPFGFLTNHGLALLCIADDPAIRMRDIAAHVDITERAAQRIVADLVQAGYVERERVGRRNTYQVQTGLRVSLPSQRDVDLNSLLNVLLPQGSSAGRRDSMPPATVAA